MDDFSGMMLGQGLVSVRGVVPVPIPTVRQPQGVVDQQWGSRGHGEDGVVGEKSLKTMAYKTVCGSKGVPHTETRHAAAVLAPWGFIPGLGSRLGHLVDEMMVVVSLKIVDGGGNVGLVVRLEAVVGDVLVGVDDSGAEEGREEGVGEEGGGRVD